MNKSSVLIGILVLLLVVGFFAFRGIVGHNAPNAGDESRQGTAAQKITVSLAAQNDSGESGTATILEVGSKTAVILTLVGAPEGIAQPAHIHEGSCAALGGVTYPLASVTGGISETLLDEVAITEIIGGLPLAVNVHQSAADIGTYVACGDITAL